MVHRIMWLFICMFTLSIMYRCKSGVVRAANGSITIWEYWNIFFHLYFFKVNFKCNITVSTVVMYMVVKHFCISYHVSNNMFTDSRS